MCVQYKAGLNRNRFRFKVLAAAVMSTMAAAGLTQAAIVVANGTFDIAVIGKNTAKNESEFLVGPYLAPFGTTSTYANATIDGETATISSSETAQNGITTDMVSLSVPSAFVPYLTTFSNGDVISEEDLEIGFAAGTTGLTFSVPVTTAITATGTQTYSFLGASGTYTYPISNTPTIALSTDGRSLQADEYSSSGTYDTTNNLTSAFSFSFSYTTPTAVPEPGAAAIGITLASAALMRRRSRSKPSPIVALETGLIDDPATNGLSIIDNAIVS